MMPALLMSVCVCVQKLIFQLFQHYIAQKETLQKDKRADVACQKKDIHLSESKWIKCPSQKISDSGAGVFFYPGSFRHYCTFLSSSCVPIPQLTWSSMTKLQRSEGSIPDSRSHSIPTSRHSWAKDKLKSPFSCDSHGPILFLTLFSFCLILWLF